MCSLWMHMTSVVQWRWTLSTIGSMFYYSLWRSVYFVIIVQMSKKNSKKKNVYGLCCHHIKKMLIPTVRSELGKKALNILPLVPGIMCRRNWHCQSWWVAVPLILYCPLAWYSVHSRVTCWQLHVSACFVFTVVTICILPSCSGQFQIRHFNLNKAFT